MGAADPVSQVDLCKERIEDLLSSMGPRLFFEWVPMHPGIPGNVRVDELTGKGRAMHPYNALLHRKRQKLTQTDQELLAVAP